MGAGDKRKTGDGGRDADGGRLAVGGCAGGCSGRRPRLGATGQVSARPPPGSGWEALRGPDLDEDRPPRGDGFLAGPLGRRAELRRIEDVEGPAALGFDCPQRENIGFNVSYGRRVGEGITCNYPGSAHYPSAASPRNPVPRAALLPVRPKPGSMNQWRTSTYAQR